MPVPPPDAIPHGPTPAPAGRRSARAAARAARADDSRRFAVLAVQRALDRRDNGGTFDLDR